MYDQQSKSLVPDYLKSMLDLLADERQDQREVG